MTHRKQYSYLPHTEQNEREMLARIGATSIPDLFQAIPEVIRDRGLNLPPALSESQLLKEMHGFAALNRVDGLAFLGAGAYRHFIPSVVWALAGRGEFLTAYTPYQPEVSQGTLQAAFEFQSLICELLEMEVANSSLYDGASALAEAALMANRIVRKNRILVPATLHPAYRQVLKSYLQSLDFTLEIIPQLEDRLDLEALARMLEKPVTAVIVQQPNFLGQLEETGEISKLTHEAGGLLIASVYPVSCGILAPPGQYQADIACGEGQPLGLPLAFGGPYYGFFATQQKYVRQMPGRLIGKTKDLEGRDGYVLTLQTREQHIRRDRSTSNICTNQFLCALASAVHLSAIGRRGFEEISRQCFEKSHYLKDRLLEIQGVQSGGQGSFFNEFVIRTPIPTSKLLDALGEKGMVGGYDLSRFDPERAQELLVCVTEIHSREDLDRYREVLGSIIEHECSS